MPRTSDTERVKFEHKQDARDWYTERLDNAHNYPGQRTWLIKLALRLLNVADKRGIDW